ncbi:hypothetical protein OJ996_15340 [Luteolibacter sp. GHJ8]|uniref:CBM6 domain-containing protein n=1 Tax=Luteolibacter rhizosphaerae TaxID=2989719 RepID=A0ABT3G549_9BACT|nr:hypothetical protein [Luteolibacter rhizosphaerae]MCW1914962.1 hypothetical protein [Luteolibacter rhizosphaerae]
MSRNLMMGVWGVLVVMMGGIGVILGQKLEIGRTAVLGGTLPASTTWQVEQQQAGGSWSGTGVLVAGRGSAVSVRMEGRDGGSAYRFRQVGGAGTVVVPTRSSGWHVKGRVAPVGSGVGWRPGQVLLERSGNLAAWEVEGLVYGRLDGEFVRGLRGPLAAAGECYELAGPYGRTTVMITDLSPDPPAGTVEVGRSFYDLGPVPFAVLSGGEPPGGLTAGVRLVPAPVTGNVKFQVLGGSNIYYMALRFYNYRAGVAKVELKNSGSATWWELPRASFNAFIYQPTGSMPPVTYPVELRVTSRFGELVSFGPVGSLPDGQRVTGAGQFVQFPESELAPVPEYRLRPVYVDRFSSVPGEFWSAGGYGGATVTERDTVVKYAGEASVRFAGVGGSGFGGVSFSLYPGFKRPDEGVLRLAVRAGSAVSAGGVGMTINGRNGAGTAVSSPAVLLPGLGTGWQVIEVPLVASGAPEVIWGLSLFGMSGAVLPTLWWDEVEFTSY